MNLRRQSNMAHDYIVYQDKNREHGYVSRSFYDGAEKLLNSILIIIVKDA